jgi:hypothetical protein
MGGSLVDGETCEWVVQVAASSSATETKHLAAKPNTL